ncbi:MAG: type II secretion system protein GspN [Myxococcota bacterium]
MPKLTSKTVVVLSALGLILLFMIVLFPWDSLARRIAWEVSGISGGRITINTLAPAITTRGAVLQASQVQIEHPAIDRIQLSELEIAPIDLWGWWTGGAKLRIWTESNFGVIDGLLGLGDAPGFVGKFSQVELARLPLRLDANALSLSGRLDGEVEVVLDPAGTLRGHMTFRSESLTVGSAALPMTIPFSRADGEIAILNSGATRIESLELEGDILEGTVSGEFGLVHRSQSLPIDLRATMRIIDPRLRQLALRLGIQLGPNGDFDVQINGSLEAPVFTKTQPSAKNAEAIAGRQPDRPTP